MAFNKNDIYTGSGSVMLFNSWTPNVSKFDTSSFYNWEQDNEPLYDLEERTYALWEKLGFPTSSVPGLSLTVSADTPTVTLQQNSTIFTDLSSCLASLPKVIRFPVLIEYANFREDEIIDLNDFIIEEEGSIEIINRGFGRAHSVSSITKTMNGGFASWSNGSHNIIGSFSSSELSATLGETSCLAIETRVLSSLASDPAGLDSRVDSGTIVAYPVHSTRKAPLAVAINADGANSPFTATNANSFKIATAEELNGYDYTFGLDDQTFSYDFSSTDQTNGNDLARSFAVANSTDITGNFYLNSLKKIRVKNCSGKIYIRNFFVNPQNTENLGIEINNSDVVLENCSAAHAKKAGFKFINSTVTLSRSAFAYRNYEQSDATTRIVGQTPGFHAVNSEVILSSTFINSITDGVGDLSAVPQDFSIIASRNEIGFLLDNSKIYGGYGPSAITSFDSAALLAGELNTKSNFVFNNSHLDFSGCLDSYGSETGITSRNSTLIFNNLIVDANKKEGIRSNNSLFLYKSENGMTVASQQIKRQLDFSANGQHIFLKNNSEFTFERGDHTPEKYGSSRFLDDHAAEYWETGLATLPAISVFDNSNIDLIHCDLQSTNSLNETACYGKGVFVKNNSKASLFGSKNGCTFVFGDDSYYTQQKSCALYGSDNSEINIHGPTFIGQFGVDILVENNSTLNIEPAKKETSNVLDVSGFDLSSQGNHTSVELHATRACLVANKNSIINMFDCGSAPTHWSNTAEGLDVLVSGLDYGQAELYYTSGFTGSGSIQFFANPQEPTVAVNSPSLPVSLTTIKTFDEQPNVNVFLLNGTDILNTYSDAQTYSQGGVCVRAVQDSVVNVTNVHFPLASNTSPLDGFYYNASGSDCDKFLIWNIADTSRLNASYLSLSGQHPFNTQYKGPDAFWYSSIDGSLAVNVIASGAPKYTPDTGNLSILDSFGAGSSVLTIPSGVGYNDPFDRFYPVSGELNSETADILVEAGLNYNSINTELYGSIPGTAENRGPFRIYWTPKSAAKILLTDLSGYYEGAYPHSGNFSGVLGPAYQIFAQGYNCSAPLSAVNAVGATNASSIYPELLKLSYDSDGDGTPDTLWTSGFYYCSEFLDDNPTQCMLDESAAYCFANSRNATLGSSGRPRKVTMYNAGFSNVRGSEAFPGDTSGSLGFKSAGIFDLKRDN